MEYSPSCNCCPEVSFDCLIASDLFGRVDLGSAWDQINGTWSISSGVLSTTSTDAMVLYATDHPGGIAAHIVSCSLQGAVGEKRRVILASASDGSTYLAVEVEFGASSGDQCGTVRLIQNGATIYSRPMRGLPPDTWVSVYACYLEDPELSGGTLWAYVAGIGTSNLSASALASATGLRVGFATSGTSTANGFAGFQWYSHKVQSGVGTSTSTVYEDCSSCEACPIWSWSSEQLGTSTGTGTDSLDEDCERTVAGDPTNLTGDPWSVEGYIDASNADIAGGYGILVPWTTGDITLTLGAYSAHFFVNGSTIRVVMSGPGVSVTEDFPDAVCAAFSFIDGKLCATTCYDLSGNKSAFGTPTGAVGTTPRVSAPAGPVASILFTRCPVCPSDSTCSDCDEPNNIPAYYKVSLSGFGPNGTHEFQCGESCLVLNGTFICSRGLGAPTCTWDADIFESPCFFTVQVTVSGATLSVKIVVSGEPFDYMFQFVHTNPGGAPYPCNDPDDLLVPYESAGPSDHCSDEGLACSVTAL